MQKQVKSRRLLEFFRCVERRFQSLSGNHWTVVCQQHGAVFPGETAHRFCQGPVARGIVGHQWQCAHAHHVVGRQRRQNILWIDLRQAGHGHGMRGVQMHDGAGAGTFLVNRAMQEPLL